MQHKPSGFGGLLFYNTLKICFLNFLIIGNACVDIIRVVKRRDCFILYLLCRILRVNSINRKHNLR